MTSLALCLGVSIATSGCYSSAVEPPSGDGGTAGDGGGAPSDGGAAGCDAQDATGDGLCDAILGWSWSGDACVLQSGCECVGADCGALFESEAACEGAFAACIAPVPGECDAQDARGEGACRAVLGTAWDGDACVVLSGCECVGGDCDALFESEAACEGAYAECIAPTPGPCDAQDARGEGACRLLIGVVWDGRQCATIGGCECVGADCEDVFGTIEECETAYAACGGSSCAEQPLPTDDCDGPTRSFGWRWDGGACEEVLRCSCSGASCDALYATERACALAHASCPGDGATDCDPDDVWCRALPPRCAAGEVPSVIDHCWGPCVPFEECGPIACGADRLPCPEGLRCDGMVCVR